MRFSRHAIAIPVFNLSEPFCLVPIEVGFGSEMWGAVRKRIDFAPNVVEGSAVTYFVCNTLSN